MDLRQEKKLREDFLVTLWEMHDGTYGGDQPTDELCKRMGIDYDVTASRIGQSLRREGFITWSSFYWISLLPLGQREAERIVEERYAAKETRVLKAIYELSGQNTTKPVGFHELVPVVGMSDRDVTGFCKGLEEQGYIEWPAESIVTITRKGIHAIDSLGQPKERSGGDTFITSIGTINGPSQVGSHNTQNVNITVTNNPEFDQAIAALLQIANSSGLPNEEIEELRGEVEKLNKLALSEAKPDSLEKAKFRFDKAKLTFEATKLIVEAAPYLHTAWEYLKLKFGG